MISIIIPTYNGADLLKKYSIPSILQQSHKDWEAIVINDGSSDNTSQVMRGFTGKDKRIKFINNQQNLGLAATLNQGVELSSGDVIMILEHDDIYLPDKIKMQMNAIDRGAIICSCNAIIYNIKSKSFTKINGGNLSCLTIKREGLNLIFPLPEENNKYLGIEDGIISARLAIAMASDKLSNDTYIHINEILTIMNSSSNTLSGVKDSISMVKRYDSVVNFYADAEKGHPEISNLIKFWKKHRLYNTILTFFPFFLRRIIYYLVDKLKKIKNKRQLAVYSSKNRNKYENLKKYRESFN